MVYTYLALVTSVTAVVHAVANKGAKDALVVLTLEVAPLAVDDAARVGLVTLVLAVGRAIAVPTLRDADAAGLAPELLLRVALVGRYLRTAQLVTAIIAVRDAVALWISGTSEDK